MPMKAVQQVVDALISNDARRATKYLSDKQVVRATRCRYRRGREKNVEITLTIGRPNYVERVFIRDCKAAGEKFPVKRVQLQRKPERRVG
jgi:hypothetical protein